MHPLRPAIYLRVHSLFVLTIAVWAGLPAHQAYAQDTNWWTQQYGTRSELLGGAVVGSLSDLSATFYNPGALSIAKDSSVLLSAKAFENQRITVKGAAFDGDDIVTTHFSTAPSLFTGTFPSKWLPGQLAYLFLTRQEFEFRIIERATGVADILGGTPATDQFSGEIMIDQRLSENWGGATWSYAVRDNIGIGVSQFVGYRGQRTRSQAIAQVDAAGDEGGTAVLINEFDYWHYRLITKLGVAVDLDDLTLGVSMTLPSVSLFGSGKTFANVSSTGFDLDDSGSSNSFLASSAQDELSPTYKSPFSIAGGTSYTFSKTTAHATVEWFNGVREYTVLDTEPIQIQSTGEIEDPNVTAELRDVFNAGVGVEHHFRERLAVYSSFVTDFSAAVDNTTTNHTISTWDIYHWSLGAAFVISGLDLTLGAAYAFGNNDVEVLQLSNDEREIFKGTQQLPVEYEKLKFFIGFAFSL